MIRNKLTTGNSITNGTKFKTSSIATGANRLVLVFVTNTRPYFQGAATTPTVSGNGLTFQQVTSVTTTDTDEYRLTCLRAMSAAPTTGQITIDFGANEQDFCSWSVVEFEGVDTSGGSGAAAVKQPTTKRGNGTALSVDLPNAVTDTARNLTVGALAIESNHPVTPGSGFSEIDQQAVPAADFGKSMTLHTQNASSAVQSTGWTWAQGGNAAAIAIELKAAVVATPPDQLPFNQALMNRFAPIVLLHRDEKLRPVNAKRVVERSSLWTSTVPGDDKRNWNKAASAGTLAAVDTEDGTKLRTFGFNQSFFLELGGWRNKAGGEESGVDPSTTNVYSNRGAIATDFIDSDPDVTPWYHAEILDVDTLRTLGGPANPAPDVGLVVDEMVANLGDFKMLCYYLYFPAHEQPVGVGLCNNPEAPEVDSHAGDWQCLALLLKGSGDDANTYEPKYVGYSGLRPKFDADFKYRPYAQLDPWTVMKVEAWQPISGPTTGLPATIGQHPQIYAALGSHSLYLGANESIELYPYDDDVSSQMCGQRDTPRPLRPLPWDLPHSGQDFPEDLLLFMAKLFAGLIGGAPGAAAGVASAGEEGLFSNVGEPIDLGDPRDPIKPDNTAPNIGEAVTLRPADVVVPGESAVATWKSRQGVSVDGRSYDAIVDREAQQWWPYLNNDGGYIGRWGQQAAEDPLGKRSGPFFPNYPRAFLLAFAKGRADGDIKYP